MPFNLSATVNILRTLKNPALLYPQCTISTFDQLPVPVSKAFVGAAGEKEPDIRAVILDKDNCFSIPHELEETFERLKKEYPGNRLLIVSNSAGTWDDPGNKEADLLEKNTGVKVLRHATKKPGCYNEIFEFLKKSPDTGVTRPDQIAVVGDRLATDVLMANMMGSWAVWVKDGPRPANEKLYGKIEAGIKGMLERRGWEPPVPSSRTL